MKSLIFTSLFLGAVSVQANCPTPTNVGRFVLQSMATPTLERKYCELYEEVAEARYFGESFSQEPKELSECLLVMIQIQEELADRKVQTPRCQ